MTSQVVCRGIDLQRICEKESLVNRIRERQFTDPNITDRNTSLFRALQLIHFYLRGGFALVEYTEIWRRFDLYKVG